MWPPSPSSAPPSSSPHVVAGPAEAVPAAVRAARAPAPPAGPSRTSRARTTATSSGPLLDKWNAAHPNEKVTFKEQSDQADQQHDDLVQHFQAKDPNYDVVSVDVVWTAEFAAKGWLQPLEGQYAIDTSELLKPTVDAATYNGKLYAAPQTQRRRPALLPQGPRADAARSRGTR